MEKILIITSCSFKKRNYKTNASDLYKGHLFKKVKKFARSNNFDFKIVSAKYGLLNPKDIIEPYDRTISNKKDVLNLQKKVISELLGSISNYKFVLIIVGSKYRKVLEPINKKNMYYVINHKGIGGYSNLMSKFLKFTRKEICKLLQKKKNNIITINDIEMMTHFNSRYFKNDY